MEQIMAWLQVNQLLVYALLFAYCAGKSGLLPFFAGLAASSGALDLANVAVATLLGGYLGDELRFFVARRYGHKLNFKRPRWQRALAITQVLMDRYGAGYIFLYRYPKGLRTIGALPVGLTDISWARFTVLNAASAALWATLLVGAGFLFGASLGEDVARGWSIISVGLLVLFCAGVWLMMCQIRAAANSV